MAHGDAREGKWRGNWRMEWAASTLHTTSELGVSSITTGWSSRLNWRACRFKWTRPFRRKTKSGFRACAITFQTQSTTAVLPLTDLRLSYPSVPSMKLDIWRETLICTFIAGKRMEKTTWKPRVLHTTSSHKVHALFHGLFHRSFE